MTQQQQASVVDDRQPIFSIAFKPRDTIRFLLQHKALSYFMVIGIISAFGSNLASYIGKELKAVISLGDVVYSSFMSGIVVFMVSTLIISALVSTIGKALSGKGTFKEMFRTMCVTTIPYIWILPILLFWMQLSPQSFFDLSNTNLTLGDAILAFVGGTAVIIASIWTFVITLVGISEVHKFSKWKAFFVFVISVICLAIVLAVIAVVTGIALF